MLESTIYKMIEITIDGLNERIKNAEAMLTSVSDGVLDLTKALTLRIERHDAEIADLVRHIQALDVDMGKVFERLDIKCGDPDCPACKDKAEPKGDPDLSQGDLNV